jgi:hypothetical protein
VTDIRRVLTAIRINVSVTLSCIFPFPEILSFAKTDKHSSRRHMFSINDRVTHAGDMFASGSNRTLFRIPDKLISRELVFVNCQRASRTQLTQFTNRIASDTSIIVYCPSSFNICLFPEIIVVPSIRDN